MFVIKRFQKTGRLRKKHFIENMKCFLLRLLKVGVFEIFFYTKEAGKG